MKGNQAKKADELRPLQDADLIAQCKSGDVEAFSHLVQRYFPAVYATACAQVRDREAAEEISQEAFLRAYLKLDSLRRPEYFPLWIHRIARNLAGQWRRQGKRHSSVLETVPLDDSLTNQVADQTVPLIRDQLVISQELQYLNAAVMRLPDPLREIVLLHFTDELSSSEIARRMGLNRSSVGRRLEKALELLRTDYRTAMQSNPRQIFRPSAQGMAKASAVIVAAAALSDMARTALLAATASTPVGGGFSILTAKSLLYSGTSKALLAKTLLAATVAAITVAAVSEIYTPTVRNTRAFPRLTRDSESNYRNEEDSNPDRVTIANTATRTSDRTSWRKDQTPAPKTTPLPSEIITTPTSARPVTPMTGIAPQFDRLTAKTHNEPTTCSLGIWYNGYRRSQIDPCGCVSKKLGGIDKEAGLVARLDELGIPSIKVDAGGFVRDMPTAQDIERTRFLLAALKKLGYGAVNVGDTDLRMGIEKLKSLAAESQIELISANLIDDVGDPIFSPCKLLYSTTSEGTSITIAVIGVTDRQTSASRLTQWGATFKDPVKAVEKYVPKLRKVADIVVLMVYAKRDATRALLNRLSVEAAPDIAIAGKFLQDSDAIDQIGGTRLVSGAFEGKHAGLLLLNVDDKRIADASNHLLEVNQDITSIAEFTDLMAQAKQALAKLVQNESTASAVAQAAGKLKLNLKPQQ